MILKKLKISYIHIDLNKLMVMKEPIIYSETKIIILEININYKVKYI